MRVLFVCKKNETYGFDNKLCRRSSGLYNSTRFIIESLQVRGVEAKIVEVIDNNCIDREVSEYKPDIAVIEALWVVPEKFPVLMGLHPNVSWYVHLHSHMPFLALEGMSMDWILRYAQVGVGLIANSIESYEALRCVLGDDEVIFLPNVYIGRFRRSVVKDKDHIDIGCFGAVRPLKNQLLQALAAIEFAARVGKPLRFHVNGSRVETGGEPVLKNLVQLFEATPNAELVQSKWNEPDEFLDYLQNQIDIGMQVSLTETFNVVSADYVTAGIPIVVSKEVKWASRFSMALDDSIPSILSAMRTAWNYRTLIGWNQHLLKRNSKRAQRMWFDFVMSGA